MTLSLQDAARVGYYPATMHDSEGAYTVYKPLPSFSPLSGTQPLVEAPRGTTEAPSLRAYPVVRERYRAIAKEEGITEGDLLAVLINLWYATPSRYRQEAIDYWQTVKQQAKTPVRTP